MAKKIKAPPGLDYSPVTGESKSLSFGVAQATTEKGGVMTAETFVGRRLFPVEKPKDFSQPWGKPTAYRHDVLLPRGASDELCDPQRLCQAYDRACFGTVRDLAVIVTLRFEEAETTPQQIRLHEIWELCRNFAARRLVSNRGMAVIPILHVPSRAARPDRRLFIGALAEAARNATAEAVERQERVRRVRDTAIEAYGGDAEAAERFLRRKHLMLGDVTPLQVAAESAEGADRVIQLIGRVQYGGSV